MSQTVVHRPDAASPATSASDGEHLRQLLEQQPACLVRVTLDGMLLAVNKAALSMLGASSLEQVLRTSIVERCLPGQQELWREFAVRVWSSGSGSA